MDVVAYVVGRAGRVMAKSKTMSKSSYSRSFRKDQLNLNQPYHKMNRKEKRLYKRWLAKNNQFDGEVVIENMKRDGLLTIEPPE